MDEQRIRTRLGTGLGDYRPNREARTEVERFFVAARAAQACRQWRPCVVRSSHARKQIPLGDTTRDPFDFTQYYTVPVSPYDRAGSLDSTLARTNLATEKCRRGGNRAYLDFCNANFCGTLTRSSLARRTNTKASSNARSFPSSSSCSSYARMRLSFPPSTSISGENLREEAGGQRKTSHANEVEAGLDRRIFLSLCRETDEDKER